MVLKCLPGDFLIGVCLFSAVSVLFYADASMRSRGGDIRCFLSMLMITFLEFCAGVILNLWLKLDIWDYSRIPFNLYGQICLPYAAVWFVLSAAAIVADDYLRYWLYGEEKPSYRL